MNTKNDHLDTLQDIRQMMERSSRFISLSGLSGIGAGICALGGAFFTYRMMIDEKAKGINMRELAFETGSDVQMRLLQTGAITFVAALLVAYAFTYMRTVRTGASVWSAASRRLLWNTFIPIVVGGCMVIRFIEWGHGGLVAPTCLIFYGLGLINGSKYTLSEIRWLGFSELLLGILNLWMIGYGLMFWALGFGLLHILYGIAMWVKYERNGPSATR